MRERLKQIELFLAVAYLAMLPFSITAAWIVFVIGLVFWIINELLTWQDRHPKRQFRLARLSIIAAPLATPIGILAAAVTVSGALNSCPEPNYGTPGPKWLSEAWQSLWTLKNLAPYFWSWRIFSSRPQLVKFSVFLFLSITCVAGFWGAIQQIFNIHPGYKYLQGTGFLGAPMAFAGQMQIASLLALGILAAELSERPKIKINPLICLLVFGNVLGVFFAGERSGWLGFAVGALTLAGMVSWKAAVAAVLALTGGAGLAYCFVPLAKTRISTLFSGNDVSVTARLEIWSKCLELIPKSPAFGIGIRRFPHFDMPQAIVPGVSKDLNHAHSNIFHLLTTAGIVGLLAFLNLYLQIALTAKRRLTHPRNWFERGIVLGLLSGSVSLFAAGLFEYNFGTSQVRMTQFFLLGLL